MKIQNLNKIRIRRAVRTRSKIKGTKALPRLSVFRSNKHIYAQLIDDLSGKTMVSISSLELKKAGGQKINKTKKAETIGESLAKKAVSAGIKEAVFDKGRYKYHGRVKAVCEEARKGGLKI